MATTLIGVRRGIPRTSRGEAMEKEEKSELLSEGEEEGGEEETREVLEEIELEHQTLQLAERRKRRIDFRQRIMTLINNTESRMLLSNLRRFRQFLPDAQREFMNILSNYNIATLITTERLLHACQLNESQCDEIVIYTPSPFDGQEQERIRIEGMTYFLSYRILLRDVQRYKIHQFFHTDPQLLSYPIEGLGLGVLFSLLIVGDVSTWNELERFIFGAYPEIMFNIAVSLSSLWHTEYIYNSMLAEERYAYFAHFDPAAMSTMTIMRPQFIIELCDYFTSLRHLRLHVEHLNISLRTVIESVLAWFQKFTVFISRAIRHANELLEVLNTIMTKPFNEILPLFTAHNVFKQSTYLQFIPFLFYDYLVKTNERDGNLLEIAQMPPILLIIIERTTAFPGQIHVVDDLLISEVFYGFRSIFEIYGAMFWNRLDNQVRVISKKIDLLQKLIQRNIQFLNVLLAKQ